MSRKLLWKLCLLITAGIVALFYTINSLTIRTEEQMSLLEPSHREELKQWGQEAEALFLSGDNSKLDRWLKALQKQENTWATVTQYEVTHIAGERGNEHRYIGYNLGRDVEWKVHLYFEDNPVMEIPFVTKQTSLLILLPDRMRPGGYWQTTRLVLQILLPMGILALVSLLLYRHIMNPLRKLEQATREFSRGNFDIRVHRQLGNRDDEISQLAKTFDQMAARIGEQIVNQRQLIADLSHELRTPLTRLDIAIESASTSHSDDKNIQRIQRESSHIRRLVEDTLTLAWLDNEQPSAGIENLDLVDLIDVIVEDARFEFPDRTICTYLPDSAEIKHSNHQAVGQALENILRNAMRYTPEGQTVHVLLERNRDGNFVIDVEDSGPGVPEALLDSIFKPFFRVDQSRTSKSKNFGLGLALARRQLNSVGATVVASNRPAGGLCMRIILPAQPPMCLEPA
ncbi:sensor histidine kinase [Microbulbifer variabilis]|uniref:sensor histidine kinase n=1 Tax=Microbulbifer variabilis TaxID=266805 RepID=UPI00036F2941|nr:histidine kinase sensor domain-containing protein [Microbulbifer variabilis]